MRKKIIAGNWKMYKTAEEAKKFLAALMSHPSLPPNIEIRLAVPFTALHAASAQTKNIRIGAQNMNEHPEGAFTGEISARMLKEAGASFVLLGHSERRQLFLESSGLINKKIKRALSEGIAPLLCIGETLEQREAGKTASILAEQLHASLEGIASEEMTQIVIAYEPVWAIGTGKTATPAIAEEAHKMCRDWLTLKYGKNSAEATSLLYGGSVKGDNAKALLSQPNIDGALVGGASLEVSNFLQIIMEGT